MIMQGGVSNKCIVLVLLLVIANVGCTTSVHPLLLKDDLSTDVDLSGEWSRHATDLPAQDNEKSRVILKRVGDTAVYDVKGEDGEPGFDALRVGKIGSNRIGEFKGGPRDAFSPFKSGLPVYGFARFEVMNDELKIYPINDPELRRRLSEKKLAYLLYEPGPGEEWLVITATTAELQSLIKSSADSIFARSPIVFKRIRAK